MSTFSSTTVGISLTLASQNPATIVSGAYVTNTDSASHSGDALYGSTAAAWTISNFGTLRGTASTSSGIELSAGGTVTNAATARIIGALNGMLIRGGTGSVDNSGTITGDGIG